MDRKNFNNFKFTIITMNVNSGSLDQRHINNLSMANLHILANTKIKSTLYKSKYKIIKALYEIISAKYEL